MPPVTQMQLCDSTEPLAVGTRTHSKGFGLLVLQSEVGQDPSHGIPQTTGGAA